MRGRFQSSRPAPDLARLGVTVDRSPEEPTLRAIARRHRLSVYDASHSELARAAPAQGVQVLE